MISRKEFLDTVKEQLNDIRDIKELPTAGEMFESLEWMNMLEWMPYVPVVHFEGRNELAENVYKKLNTMVDERADEILEDMRIAYEEELEEIRAREEEEDDAYYYHDYITPREVGHLPKHIKTPWD